MATKPVEIEILIRDRLTGTLQRARAEVGRLEDAAKGAKSGMERLESQAESLRGTVEKIAGAFALKELVSKIATVRGEFQQLEVAFNTMLGSTEKADALMQQLIRTAAVTPFDLQGVANGAKQLLAYGEDVERVNDDLIRLGNIAAGLSQPLNDIVYLYGTTMTQGRLYTQDLNQFTGRGIPMIRELATVLGVAEGKVKEMVEAGKVGFPEVQQVIRNLTDEGGTFYNLMEEQSKTITGRIGNIEDAIETMFNDIGKQSEGIIGGALDTVSALVENYERVGRVLAGVAATYGTYKAAVMAVTAMQALQTAGVGALTAAETLHYGWLVLVEKAQKLLNATMLSNPYVLVATAVGVLVAAMLSAKTETERLREAEEAYQGEKQKAIEAEEEHRRRLEELCGVAGNESLATDTRRAALNKLEQKYPDIFAKYDTEAEKLRSIKQIKEEIAAIEAGQSITLAENELAGVERRIRELEEKSARTVTKSYTGSGGAAYTVEVSGLSAGEMAELKNLRAKRRELSATVRKEQAEAYFEDLTGVSNETLEAQIRQRENLLALMKTQEAQKGRIVSGEASLRGSYTRDELQWQLNKLRSEQNRRGASTGSSADWAAEARKEYEAALKEYNDFMADTGNSLTQEDYEARAKELKEALDAAKKAYDKTKAEDTGGDKAAKQAEKEAQKREQAERKAADSLLALEEQNQQAEIDLKEEGTEKRLAQIEADYEKRKAETEKKAKELAELNEKAGTAGTNENGLTQEQQDEIDKANKLAEESRRRQRLEAYDEEVAAMREWLQEYGTYQQQKLAIAEEYAEKIAAAQSEGERLRLGKERDSRLAGVEARELSAGIDWQAVFGGFGSMFEDMMTPALEKAKAYMETAEFRNADQASQQALVEAVQQMTQSVGAAGSASFGQLGQKVEEYEKALEDLTDAQEDYRAAYEGLGAAQEAYRQALANGTAAEQEAAKAELERAQQEEQAAAERVDVLQSAADAAQQAMTGTATTLKASMDGVVSGLRQLSGGSLSGVYNGLITLGEGAEKQGGAVGKAMGKLAESLKSVPVVGWVAEILDVFKDGLSDFFETLLESVFNSVSGILSDVLSGDLFVTMGESVANGVTGILDTLTFGLFDGIFGSGESDETLEEDLEYLAIANEDLQRAIENLTEVMEDVATGDATEVYEDQKAKLELAMANTQESMSRAAEASNRKNHSSAYRINEEVGDSDWKRISELTGETVTNAQDFFKLSSEAMAKVAQEAPDLYSKIKQYADDGYQDAAQYMDTYIEYYEQLLELEEAYLEKLTDVSFDDVRDSFKDTLLDMEADAEDFAEELEETLLNAIVESMMSTEYAERLEEWYRAFADAMEDGTMTEEEIAALRAEYNAIVEDAVAERNALLETLDFDTGSSTSQTGNSGSFTAMSQEQGTKLEGMFTSGLMHWASMDSALQDVSAQMGTALEHLRLIEENTGSTADRLGEIGEDIKKIIRDGLKVK